MRKKPHKYSPLVYTSNHYHTSSHVWFILRTEYTLWFQRPIYMCCLNTFWNLSFKIKCAKETDNSIDSNSSGLQTAKKHLPPSSNDDFSRKLRSASKQANPGRYIHSNWYNTPLSSTLIIALELYMVVLNAVCTNYNHLGNLKKIHYVQAPP